MSDSAAPPPPAPAPEAWMRGPLPDLADELQPAGHALVQAGDEIARAAEGLAPAQLWARPGGAASVGFHVRHAAGALDRLLTYARDEPLGREQLAALRREGEPGDPPADASSLVALVRDAVERALAQYRATPLDTLGHPRGVGRARLPTTVRGLLFHAAEHTQRHAGQAVTTARIVRGLGLGAPPRPAAVTGLGGVFFRARDPEALQAWYVEHLGFPVDAHGYVSWGWADPAAHDGRGMSVWSAMREDTPYLAPSTREFMVNYRVADRDAVLARLRAAGATVDEKVEDSEFGRFGWATDPEGNRFELWEPPGMRPH